MLLWKLLNNNETRTFLRTIDPANIEKREASIEKTDLTGIFNKYDGSFSDELKESWPGFRGKAHDNISRENGIISRLNKSNIKLLWEISLGEGYAGAAIAHGAAYILDYNSAMRQDQLRVFSMDNGKEIWRRAYKVSIKRNHGMSRTVPAVSGNYCVTIGPKCHVMCVNAKNGDFLWGIDLAKEYKSEVPLWYTGQCPLLDNELAIIAPGGDALLIGVELKTGKIRWKTPNPQKYVMSHASVIPMNINNKKVYTWCAGGAFIGTDENGTLLWETTLWNHKVVSPSAVQFSANKIILTAGYGAGSAIFIINRDFSINRLAEIPKSVFACEQHTPVFYNNHLFTVNPADSGASRKQLICMDTGGKVRWTSGEYRFGLGPFFTVDDKIFVLDDNGILTMVSADPVNFNILGQAKILDGREAWAPMALAGGRLLVRDFTMMRCYDIKEKK
ncbi:MAG: hypothetical protein A2096_08145 [Spirochaetes bacterium GWF1_41_5]|nr:MAG: hypothetical protein A2096_08145 [Spirochaetes bacterium GWF1_41_5]